jgi:DNA-binding transcriptional LysR family regulator
MVSDLVQQIVKTQLTEGATDQIEFRHLRAFVAVAEELNFSRAAERLHMAQPPLTRSIRHLEKELDVKLFHRNTRHIELTEAGRVYLEEVRQILLLMREAASIAQLANRGEVGQLVVGFEGSSAYDIVPLSVKAFREKFPGIKLLVREMVSGSQMQALCEGEIGIGFVVLPLPENRHLRVECIFQEPLIVALPQLHSLATRSNLNLADLRHETFIVCPRHDQCGLYDHVISVCHQAGFSPLLTQETSEVQSILGFVGANLGISLLPASARKLKRSDVIYRALHPPIAELELAIAWRQDSLSPLLTNFLEITREVAQQLSNLNPNTDGFVLDKN